MRLLVLLTSFVISTLLLSTTANAVNLITVYNQALKSDPVYQSAKEQFFATTQAYPQARAALLPNISGQFVYSYTHPYVFGSFLNQFIPTARGVNNYNARNYTVTLTQPIINFASWAAVGVAKYQVAQAEATYIAALQNLVLRVANAYFAVLQAEDTVRYDEAQKRAIYKQYVQAKARYDAGLDPITSLLNARASYDLVYSREIADKNSVVIAREQLRQITGVYYQNLDTLKVKFPLQTPYPDSAERWVEAADAGNLNIQASRLGADAARLVIKENHAGHLPTLNGVLTYNRYRPSNNGFAVVQPDERVEEAQLQLNLPIYQGGLVLANTRQAVFNYEKALYDLETTHRQVDTNTRQAYYTILSYISKVEADREAIVSNQASVDSTAAALAAGTRTIVDLLNIEQNLYQAQTTLAADQYSYLNQTLALKQQAGILCPTDLVEIDHWLGAPPMNNTVTVQKLAPLAKEINVKQLPALDKNTLQKQGLDAPALQNK